MCFRLIVSVTLLVGQFIQARFCCVFPDDRHCNVTCWTDYIGEVLLSVFRLIVAVTLLVGQII